MSHPGRIWKEPRQVEPSEAYIMSVGGSPLLAKILVRRGVTTSEEASAFLDLQCYQPVSPFQLPGMSAAVLRLKQAIQKQELIGIWGDFDVDGQTSTAILLDGLRHLGANVVYRLPVREFESHGINLPQLKTYIDSGVQVLLTCDTGIAAHDAVKFAAIQGVDTIITDHHALSGEIPPAKAVVNPRQLQNPHPLSYLCGAGTALKVVEGLSLEMGVPDLIEDYYDLAALGTVADVATLSGENRYIVWQGISSMRQNTRMSIHCILKLNDIQPDWITEEHIGFILAPRLNAVGRLGDANKFVEFLLSDDGTFTQLLASQAEAMNSQRQLLSNQVFKAARDKIEKDKKSFLNPVLIVSHPSWPSGVIGIAAGRLANLYSRPVILITARQGAPARGSARSVEGVDITAAIAANKEHLLGYGGHPLAAGLSIDAEKISAFSRGINRTVQQMTGGKIPEQVLEIDAYFPLSNVSMQHVMDLDRLAPCGHGNPLPVLVSSGLKLQGYRKLGKSGDHLLVTVEREDGVLQKVIWWQADETLLPEGVFDLAYSARASNYRGLSEVQIEWIDARRSEETMGQELTTRAEVVDFRQEADPISVLAEIQDQGWAIWFEGLDKIPFPVVDRFHLSSSNVLAILTVPPGVAELQNALFEVRPSRVLIFGFSSILDQLEPFLRTLTGLIRYIIRSKDGWVQVNALAAVMGQREITVAKGLEWLAAHGIIQEINRHYDRIQYSEGGVEDPVNKIEIEREINTLLLETAAFRKSYMRVDQKWFEDILIFAKGKEA